MRKSLIVLTLIVSLVSFVSATDASANVFSRVKLIPESGWAAEDGVLPTLTLTYNGYSYSKTPLTASTPINFDGFFETPFVTYDLVDNFGHRYLMYDQRWYGGDIFVVTVYRVY